MTNKNYQTAVYTTDRDIKQHEQQMLDLVAQHVQRSPLRVLDIGCADGRFLGLLRKKFPHLKYFGIDLSEELIERGRQNNPDIQFHIMDAANVKSLGKFDLIIASGILSIFEEPDKILENWLSILNEEGILFIFGRFNTADIDTVIRFRVGELTSPWEGGWTSFSLKNISAILSSLGYKVDFRKFMFDGILPKSNNPVQTSTLESIDGGKFLISGGNVIAEHYFAVISKI